MNEQTLLFGEAEIGSAPPARSFVFERLSAADLFEQSTGILLEAFVEACFWRAGFAGTEEEKARLMAAVGEKIVARFIDDPEFASRVGSTEDSRPEVEALVKKYRSEIVGNGGGT